MLPVNILLARRHRRQRLRNFNIERIHLRNSYDPFDLDDLEFVKRFRLTKHLCHQFIDDLLPFMRNSVSANSIDPRTRVLVALSFYATGSYQRLVGQSHNISISQQSVSSCIREVSALITLHLSDRYIKFPTTNEEGNEIKLKFHEKFNFPGVIGAIDCTHIKILCPNNEEHNYLNRKGYHSLNVQMICDSNLRILAVNPQHAGATHDAFVWRMSVIRQEMERLYNLGDRSSWLLGDSGYPLQPWLLTPIVDAPPDTPQGRYTAAHCSARNCIERCFGVLKQRFRCLNGERTLRYQPEIVGQIISSCAVLHNICTIQRLDDIEEIDQPQPDFAVPEGLPQNDLLNEGDRVRQLIIRRYFN